MGQGHSIEQVCDGMINLLSRNLGARTPLIADAHAGDTLISVDNTFHLKESETIVFIDLNENHIEYHTILSINSTNSISLLEALGTNFIVSDKSIVQRAIHGLVLSDDSVLFGDRKVIPNNDVVITIEPSSTDSFEWVYLRGGLSMQHSLVINTYIKLDDNEGAIRGVHKYCDAIMELLFNNIHLDIVNDEIFLTEDASASNDYVTLPSLTGWVADNKSHRYEIQDNTHAETDFYITNILVPQSRVILDRIIGSDFLVQDKALFRRRVRYFYNSMISNVEYGLIQKGSQMYKAGSINWWGKECIEIMFPQATQGGIT